ncbi:phosphoribosylglycinamide formyltransferase [Parvularcula dongshanensis]|uniref:Phosphoribosylglycinamide formyltransferase n=1 Tax=Parvularcula dongshanensis TaxID=1173995 RepID=A0A840I162_9PROT|nr:phosphoribosylglycinamide formyltransferase [Parvularcula dongshanensis]MBB4658786.1 phosphoribosylglycinamide formyltransferase-1 [Parvularcula dongshanensis]
MTARVAVLISGSGSNLQALLEACADEAFPAEIVKVVSNRPGVYGLERAAAAGVRTEVIDHKAYEGRAPFEAALRGSLEEAAPDVICLAGFMRVLAADFVRAFEGRMLNIHPSLLPAFRGLHTHRQALEAGVKIAGCTVHVVTPALDDGPIVGQAAVPVLPGDTEDSLAARILKAEHRLYPAALRAFVEKRAAEAEGASLFVV